MYVRREPWEADPQVRGDLEHLRKVGGDGAQLDAVPEVGGQCDAVLAFHGDDGASVVRQDTHGGGELGSESPIERECENFVISNANARSLARM